MPRVTVVIPCYNQGQFLDEAIDSVLAQTYTDFEIIVVNDGSTDVRTQQLLHSYKRPKTVVIYTTNQGLGEARNTGIRAGSGAYILPLDADDRIGASYIEQAVNILDAQPNTGIVYCQAEYFGARIGAWNLKPYSFPEILIENVIFSAAMFRKSDWEISGGYSRLPVWEDYDFWLSIIELKRDVVRIPEVLFYYRKHSTSKTVRAGRSQLNNAHAEIWRNHAGLFNDNLPFILGELAKGRKRINALEDIITSMRRSIFWQLRKTSHKVLSAIKGRETDYMENGV